MKQADLSDVKEIELKKKIDLKPCPFCGNKYISLFIFEDADNFWCSAICQSCQAEMTAVEKTEIGAKRKVKQRWNTRKGDLK